MKDRGTDDEQRPFAVMLEQNELDELIVQPPPGLNRFFAVINAGMMSLSKTLRLMEFRSINFATYEKPFGALQKCTSIEVIVFDWCYNVNNDMAKELTSASFPVLRSEYHLSFRFLQKVLQILNSRLWLTKVPHCLLQILNRGGVL